MALVLQDRVSVNSTGSGTGNLALGSAYPGFRTFASCVPDGSIVYYTIANQAVGYDTEWEVGYGKYVLGTNTLVRNNGNSAETGVYSSSNSNAYVNFTAGTNGLQIFITQPSEQAIFQEVNGDVKLIQGAMTISEDGTLGTTLPNTAYQAFTTGNYYMQSNMQNLGSGASASSDWVATADNGSDTEFYVDLGMASSGYNYPDFSAVRPNSAYVISTGSDLRIIAGKYGANVSAANASATDIVFVAGDLLNDGQRARIKGLTGNVILSNTTNPSDTGQKLQVIGTSYFSDNAAFNQFVYSAANTAAGNSTTLATKGYVDTFASGINVHSACNYATTADLGSVTYNNGTDGVGATLTNAGTQAALVIDGHTFTNTDVTNGVRVLVKNESSPAYNGIYVVTNQGSGSTNWVLTRSTDYDTGGTGAGAISVGDYTYILSGSTNAATSWVQTTTGTITVGTTAIVFVQFAAATQYTGTAPINVSGQTISLTGIVPIANGGTNLSSYTTGDILYSTGTNILGKRAIGSTDNVLVVNGGVPTWGQLNLAGANAVSGTLTPDHGGTGIATYTLGDIIYSNATNTLAKLPGQTTTTQKFLGQTGDGVNSAAPTWSTVPVASITGLAPSATTDTSNASNITSGTLPTGRLSGSYTGITGVGTLTAGTWTANVVGASYGGTGVAGTITGIPYANGIGAYTAASAANVVTLLGSTAVANATYAVSAGSATTATTATNIAGGAAGSIPYQSASGTTQLLATASGVLVGGATPSYSTAPTLTGTNFSGIPNSATTATAANTASAIVARDASGNFSAGTITANLTGTASSATNATNASAITITNDAATAVAVYPIWSSANTGNNSAKTTSAALSFVPSTGTLSSTVFSGSGASLTNLNASNVASGTIPSAILGNSTAYVGTTAIPLNRASANQALTGITSATFPGGTSGSVQLIPAAVAGTGTVLTMPATTGTVITSGDTATVTNNMLAGSIANAKLANSSTTINGTAIALGSSGTITATATNALTIGTGLSGTSYNGSAAVTIANTGVTSIVAGTNVTISGSTGAVTINASGGLSLTNDTTTNATYYPTLTTATTGSISAANTSSTKLFFNPSTGLLTATSMSSNSDERLKEDWKDVSPTFLVDLAKVKHGTFKRIDAGNREPGVTAQSLQAVLPEAVAEGADGYLSVNYGGAALVAAIELAKVVEELRAEVKELKAKLANGA